MSGIGTVADESPLTEIQESCGPLGPVTGGALAMLATMQKSEVQRGGKVNEEDRAKLTSIGVALQLYATDFDRFPMSLSELYADEYLPSLKAFEAPGGKAAVKTKDDIDTRSDYVYVPGLTPVSLSDSIIVYDKPYVLGNGERNVLFINGLVETIPEATFRLWMKAQGANVKD